MAWGIAGGTGGIGGTGAGGTGGIVAAGIAGGFVAGFVSGVSWFVDSGFSMALHRGNGIGGANVYAGTATAAQVRVRGVP